MSVRVSYSGELKVRIRIHMCKKTEKQEEECGERAGEERRGNKYAKRSGLRPTSVRASVEEVERANRAARSPFPVRSRRRGKLISIMGSGGSGGGEGGGDSDPSSSSGGKEQKRRSGLAEYVCVWERRRRKRVN